MKRVTVRALLLDIDGVLAVSWQPLPGAVEAMRTLRDAALPVRFLTNTTSRTRASVASALRNLDIAVADDELLTAGVATAEYLRSRHPGVRCLLLNDGPRDDLADVTLVAPDEHPGVVVIGSAGPSFTWDALNRCARAVIDGAALVAMHGSMIWQTDAGICIDGGAYVTALERATGSTATVIGKPAPAMFEAALAQLEIPASEAVMVGDDLYGDVLAAQAIGIQGVLVRTGKFRPDMLATSPDRPAAVLDSIADLPEWLGVDPLDT